MILDSAARAVRDILSPGVRSALVKTLLTTLAALAALWWAALQAIDHFAGGWLAQWTDPFAHWVGVPALDDAAGMVGLVILGIAFALALAFLIAPLSAVIAGLFLDDAAETIERRDYPSHEPGRALPLTVAVPMAIRFFIIVVVCNLIALVLLLVPGVNLVAFFAVNGYLLGREFFDFAAMRQRPVDEARALRRRHSGTVLLGGLVVAGVLAIPVVNLVTPLFGAALMVHLHKKVAERDRHVSNALAKPQTIPLGRAGAAGEGMA